MCYISLTVGMMFSRFRRLAFIDKADDGQEKTDRLERKAMIYELFLVVFLLWYGA